MCKPRTQTGTFGSPRGRSHDASRFCGQTAIAALEASGVTWGMK